MLTTSFSLPALPGCSNGLGIIVCAGGLAAQARRGQKCVDGRDYIEHPIEVVHNLLEAGLAEPHQLAAAYLHDALEKGPADMQSLIAADLGNEVLLLVDALTDDQSQSSEGRRAQQLDRVAAMPLAARQIKLADRLANLRSPRPDWSPEQRQRYAIHSYALLETLQGSHAGLEAQLRQRLSLPVWRI